uniref:DUF4220 domain-containing protein n=1 Tax=Leersia perrieri TaxID=77586 RepID=A0A0D9W246_9ORYZ
MERTVAMMQANLGNMRSSSKKSKLERRRIFFRDTRDQLGGNEHALMVAHDLLYITKGAFVDHLDDDHPLDFEDVRSQVFRNGWKEMVKVVEMELSLMYDILYTKAAVVHTWFGYAIRVVSPVVSATALLLFWSSFHAGKDDHQRRHDDIVITYILMAGTVFLDIRCLLRAAVSTWTYTFLIDSPCCWLHHGFPARWRVLRRFLVSLYPCRLLHKEPTSYRMWPGTIGQYNLFHECLHHDTTSVMSGLVKKVASDDQWMEYEYHYSRGTVISAHVRELLFDCIWQYMKLAYPVDLSKMKGACEPCSCSARVDSVRELEEALDFLPEFQESILILHIATDVFYLSAQESDHNGVSSKQLVKAIKTLSDYLVFLVAVRPSMLPGLKLRSLYEATQFALEKIWSGKRSSSSCNSARTEEKCLADILRAMEEEEGETVLWNPNSWRRGYRTRNWKPDFISKLYDSSIVLSDGIRLAEIMLRWLRHGRWCSNFGIIRGSINELPSNYQLRWYKGYLQSEDHPEDYSSNDEFLLQRAHSLFHICKRAIVDSVINVDADKDDDRESTKIIRKLMKEPMLWRVMEMELSLMYDILYTKAGVIHTWIGYSIRTLSPFAIATSFLLFHFSGNKDHHRVVDIVVTYVLLCGALFMETTSLLSSLGSCWALHFLCTTQLSWLRHEALCAGRWHRLRRMVLSLRKIVTVMTAGYFNRSREWSGTIGQFNLLSFRAGQ